MVIETFWNTGFIYDKNIFSTISGQIWLKKKQICQFKVECGIWKIQIC